MLSPLSEWAFEQAPDPLGAVEQLARAAGRVIMAGYVCDFQMLGKADQSPLTLADERAEAPITSVLLALRPAWQVVAEEAASRGQVPAAGLCVASSRSHGDEEALQCFLQRQLRGQRVVSRITAGSSLKFGLLAAGEADVYPRFGRIMEWDTSAGHAVLAAAGCNVCTLAGQSLRYGKPGYENPHFVAWGAAPAHGPVGQPPG